MELYLRYYLLPTPPSFQSDCCCCYGATAAHLPENYTFDSLTEFLCKSTAEKWKIIFCCSICGTRSTLQQLSYKASFKNDLEPKTRRLHQKKKLENCFGLHTVATCSRCYSRLVESWGEKGWTYVFSDRPSMYSVLDPNHLLLWWQISVKT